VLYVPEVEKEQVLPTPFPLLPELPVLVLLGLVAVSTTPGDLPVRRRSPPLLFVLLLIVCVCVFSTPFVRFPPSTLPLAT